MSPLSPGVGGWGKQMTSALNVAECCDRWIEVVVRGLAVKSAKVRLIRYSFCFVYNLKP